MGKTVIGSSGHGSDLSNTTTESFSEPSCLFNKLAWADNHPAVSAKKYGNPKIGQPDDSRSDWGTDTL